MSVSETTLAELSIEEGIPALDALLLDIDESTSRVFHEIDQIVDTAENELFCVVTNHINEIFSQLLDSITEHKMEYQKSSESDTSDFGDIFRNLDSQNRTKISCSKPRSKTVTENYGSSKKSTCFKETFQINKKESTRVEDVLHENFSELDGENSSNSETPKLDKSYQLLDRNMNHRLSDKPFQETSYPEANISLNTSIVRNSVLSEDIENQEIHQFQPSVATSVFSDGKKLREERPSLSSQQEEFGKLNITLEFSTCKKRKISYENVLKPVNVWQRPAAMQKQRTRMHFTNPLSTCNKNDDLTVILDAEKPDTPYKCPSNKPVYKGAKVPFQHGNIDPLIKLTLNANSEIEKEHTNMDDYIELNDSSLTRELDREYKKVMHIEDFCNSPNRIIEVIENGLHGDPVESQSDMSTTSFKINLDISTTTPQNYFQDSVELSKSKVVSLPHQEQLETKTTQLSSVENYDATQEPSLLPKTVPGSSVELVNRIKNNNCQETSALKEDCISYKCNTLVSSQLNISSVLQGTTALKNNSFTKESEHYVENTKFENFASDKFSSSNIITGFSGSDVTKDYIENLGYKVSTKSLENKKLVTLDEIQLAEAGNIRSVSIKQYNNKPQFTNETTTDTDNVCISLDPTFSTANFANNSIFINSKPQTEGHLESINYIPFEENLCPASVVASSFGDQIVPKNNTHKNYVPALKSFKRSCAAFRNEAIKIPASCNSSTQNSSCNNKNLDFNRVGVHSKFSKMGCQNQNFMLNSTKSFTQSKQFPNNTELLARDENIICISDALSSSNTTASSSANEIILLCNNNITSCGGKTADNFREVSNSSGVSTSIQSFTKNVTDLSCNKDSSFKLFKEGSYIKLPVDICNKNIENYSAIANCTTEFKDFTDFTSVNYNVPLTVKDCQKVITNPAEGDCRIVSSSLNNVFKNYNLFHDKEFAFTNFSHKNIPKSPTDGNNANTTNNFNIISIRGANELEDSMNVTIAKNNVPPNQHYKNTVAKSTKNYANTDLGIRSNIFSLNDEYISLDCLSSDTSLLENIYPTTELTDIPLPPPPSNESDCSIKADTYCVSRESLSITNIYPLTELTNIPLPLLPRNESNCNIKADTYCVLQESQRDSNTNICPTTELTDIPLPLSPGNESDCSIRADTHCVPQENLCDGNTNICPRTELTDIPLPLSCGNESDQSIKADTYCVPQASLCDGNTNICPTTELTDIPLPFSPGNESGRSIKADTYCVSQENLCDGNTNICPTTELTDIPLPLSPGNESDCSIRADTHCVPQENLCDGNTNICPTTELTDIPLPLSCGNESDQSIKADTYCVPQASLCDGNANICPTTELTDIPLQFSPGNESGRSIKADTYCVSQENLCDGNTNICPTTELTDIPLPLSSGNESDCSIKTDKAFVPQESLCDSNTNTNIYPTTELTDILLPSPVNESDCSIMVDAQQSLCGSSTNTQNSSCKIVKQIDNTKGLPNSKCCKSELKDNSPKESKQIASLHNNEPLKGVNIKNTQVRSNNNSMVIENPVRSTSTQKLELPHISSKIGNHCGFIPATQTSVNVPNRSIDVISATTITSTFTKENNYTITSGEYEKGYSSKEFSNTSTHTCLKESTNSTDVIASKLLTNAISANTTCVTEDISVPKREPSTVSTNSLQSSTTVSVPVAEITKSNETKRDTNKPASKTTGVKRPAPISDNDHKSSKKYKPSEKVVPNKQNYSKAKETTYTNDPRWSLYNFSRPEDCFEVVRNQWCCSYLPNPHEDLTCRFSDRWYPFSSNFIIPGNDQNNTVECLAIYDDQINAVKCEMETLKNDLDLYGSMWNNRRIRQTIDRLNKLRDIHTQLLKAREEAYHFYKYYQDPNTGWNARYMSDYKRNEVVHQLQILNSYESFYGFC